jgi:hypothetical protein
MYAKVHDCNLNAKTDVNLSIALVQCFEIVSGEES